MGRILQDQTNPVSGIVMVRRKYSSNRNCTFVLGAALVIAFQALTTALFAQETGNSAKNETATVEPPPEDQPAPKVDINPGALDTEIAARLQSILEATKWFQSPRVKAAEGVVFLEGTTTTPERKDWATKLASNTEDVVAVANRITVTQSSIWDFSPAWSEIDDMRRNAIQKLPAVVLALLILVVTVLAAKGFSTLSRRIIGKRTDNPLLRELLTKALTIPVLLIGIFLALRVTGLTSMAATVLGGTGILGLILGIAFRDIAENFLASLLISMQRPFRTGDKILVEGREGLVQAVTTRGTIIMTPDGNHVRIPNSIIYKSVIENLTANPNQRQQFTLSIDAKSSLADSQAAVLEVLKNHEAVLQEPEPLVLVDSLGRSVAVLRILFWLDVEKHSKEKVRSALIRLAKIALHERREKSGVAASVPKVGIQLDGTQQTHDSDHAANTPAEGTLESESHDIEKQARNSRLTEEGTDLLQNDESQR